MRLYCQLPRSAIAISISRPRSLTIIAPPHPVSRSLKLLDRNIMIPFCFACLKREGVGIKSINIINLTTSWSTNHPNGQNNDLDDIQQSGFLHQIVTNQREKMSNFSAEFKF